MDYRVKYVLLALFWTIWCVVHSGMISITFTNFLKNRLGARYRHYRLFFNVTAFITLIPLGIFSYAVQNQPIFLWNGFLTIFQILLLTIAVILFLAGARYYNMFQFLGLRHITESKPHEVLTGSGILNTTGVLGMIRHPWYAGTIAIIWARNLDFSAMIINIILTAYIFIGAFLEEKKLLLEFDDEYRAYQEHVSPFFPYKWLKSKIRN